jgi:hypothetical protein
MEVMEGAFIHTPSGANRSPDINRFSNLLASTFDDGKVAALRCLGGLNLCLRLPCYNRSAAFPLVRPHPVPTLVGMSSERLVLFASALLLGASLAHASAAASGYEKEFPYTPNVRGIRTADWKYIYYPHGDGSPDRYRAELYHLSADPLETRNLIDQPACAEKLAELKKEHARLMRRHDAVPDRMPLDNGVVNVLPKF